MIGPGRRRTAPARRRALAWELMLLRWDGGGPEQYPEVAALVAAARKAARRKRGRFPQRFRFNGDYFNAHQTIFGRVYVTDWRGRRIISTQAGVEW